MVLNSSENNKIQSYSNSTQNPTYMSLIYTSQHADRISSTSLIAKFENLRRQPLVHSTSVPCFRFVFFFWFVDPSRSPCSMQLISRITHLLCSWTLEVHAKVWHRQFAMDLLPCPAHEFAWSSRASTFRNLNIHAYGAAKLQSSRRVNQIACHLMSSAPWWGTLQPALLALSIRWGLYRAQSPACLYINIYYLWCFVFPWNFRLSSVLLLPIANRVQLDH